MLHHLFQLTFAICVIATFVYVLASPKGPSVLRTTGRVMGWTARTIGMFVIWSLLLLVIACTLGYGWYLLGGATMMVCIAMGTLQTWINNRL